MSSSNPSIEQLTLSESVLYGGERQWRLARVELANWGTFCGFHQLEVSRKGLLITGPSGSGKSTLLDAITTVLTPPGMRHLNAAARSDTSRGDDRTLISYIRGAWRRSADDLGEVVSNYLRPNTATWSGILLQYRCLDDAVAVESRSKRDEPIALVVLFNLKAGSNSADGLKTMYIAVRGEHSLNEFQPYVVHGIEVRKAKKDFEDIRVFTSHAPFEAYFRQLMGIRSRKTLELLHKTQAAKNFGSLDDLLRNFMLDEPETLELADSAVEQFTALDVAHKNVVDQRLQMETLEPLLQISESVGDTLERQAENRDLEDHLESCTEQFVLECKRKQLESAEHDLYALDESIDQARADLARNQEALSRAQSFADEQGGLAISTIELRILTSQEQIHEIELNRQGLLSDIASMGITELPHTLSEWQAFKRDIENQAHALAQDEELKRDEHRRTQGRPALIRDAIDEIDRELRHLRGRLSNIPRAHDSVRCAIAHAIGLRSEDLPFMGELISVKPEFSHWQGAIERLLGKRSLTLLVPVNVIKVTAEYVEHHNLGLRLEYVAVPKGVEIPDRTPSARSTVRRLEVAVSQSHPEFAQWVQRELRTRWNYECVDSTDEFDRYDYALSIHGQIKQKQRYIKDDRSSLTDQRHWYLGTDNERKIKEYMTERETLETELKEAEAAAFAIERAQKDAQNLMHAAHNLNERSWANYDIDRQKQELRKDEDELRQLR